MHREYIDSLYNKFRRESNYETKSQFMFNIIEIKIKFNLKDYRYSLYTDIKLFLKYYIKCREFKDYGYDSLNHDKILQYINYLAPQKSLNLLLYLKRTLQKSFNDVDWLDKPISKTKVRIYMSKYNILMAILYKSTYSLVNMIIFLLFLFFIICLILYPVSDPIIPMFEIEHGTYHSNSIINHIINVCGLILNLDLKCKVTTLSSSGVILYGIGKLLFWIVISNFVLLKIEKKLSIE